MKRQLSRRRVMKVGTFFSCTKFSGRLSGYWRANKCRQLNYEYMISSPKILTVSGLKNYREQDSQNQLFALVFA